MNFSVHYGKTKEIKCSEDSNLEQAWIKLAITK